MTRITPMNRVLPAEIVRAVAAVESIPLSEILGNGKRASLVVARARMAFALRHMTTSSWPEVGRAMGRSSHSTVYCAARRAEFPCTAEAYVHAVRERIVMEREEVSGE